MQGMASRQDFPKIGTPKNLLGILLKLKTLGHTLSLSDYTCIFHRFPGDAEAAGPGNTL